MRGMSTTAEEPQVDQLEQTSKRWALAVYFAIENAHKDNLWGIVKRKGRPPKNIDPNVCPAGIDTLAFSMWQYARSNLKDVMVNLAPRAMGILKQHEGGMTDEVIAEEEKSIAEAEAILDGAIAEALVYKQ